MEIADVIRYFGALALVLALVGAAALAMRKFGGHQFIASKTRRLAIVESLMLGSRHRLYLVRCDGNEHMIVVGPQGATQIGTPAARPAFTIPTGEPA